MTLNLGLQIHRTKLIQKNLNMEKKLFGYQSISGNLAQSHTYLECTIQICGNI